MTVFSLRTFKTFLMGLTSGILLVTVISAGIYIFYLKDVNAANKRSAKKVWYGLPSENVFYTDKKTAIPKYDGSTLINLGDVFCGNLVSTGDKNEDVINYKFMATAWTMDVNLENPEPYNLPEYPRRGFYFSDTYMCRVLIAEKVPCESLYNKWIFVNTKNEDLFRNRLRNTADYFNVDACGKLILRVSHYPNERNEYLELYMAMRIDDKWQIVY